MGRLADKNILIAGGNAGIGLAAGQDFDREGARVAVKLDHVTRTYRRDAILRRARKPRDWMVDGPGLPQDPLQVRLWPFLQLARRFEVNRITNPWVHVVPRCAIGQES